DETTPILKDFVRQDENQFNHKVKTIRSDNGTEFKNNELIEFYGLKGIKREYSNARTSQQNGVAERKNMALIEAARTMLAYSFLPTTFWAEAVNTACYFLKRVLVTKPQNKTPYELLTGKQPILSYLRSFGCHVTILTTIDQLGKFDGKSDSGFLVGYSVNSKAFRKSWCDEFEELIKNMFQMSSMGELTFFLRLQIASTPIKTQKPLVKDEEATDVDVTLKTSHLQAMKRIFRYLKGQPKLGLCYPKVSSLNLEAYSNNDYAGANLDRKSTIEARVANPLALVAQQQQVYHSHTHPTHLNQNSSTRTHQAATRHRGKAVVNSPQPIYDQEPSMVDDDEDTSKDKEIDKLMALISLSFKKIYKPTNNNLRTSSNTSHANQDNSLRIHRNAGYEGQRSGIIAGARDTVGSSMVQKSGIQCYNCKEYRHVARECQKSKRAKDASYHWEKMLLCKPEEDGIQLNAEQADWMDDTDDESDDQELEAHYMYMAKLQQVSPDVDDSGPIFNTEPEQKVQNDDHYDVFAINCQHSEQSKSVHNTYLIEQDAQYVSIVSMDMNYDNFKNKNKSLTEANNKLSVENDQLYADYKKSKAELERRNSVEYASEMELEFAKAKGNGGNQFRQYAGQNVGNLNGYNAVQNVRNQVAQNPRVQNDGNQNQIGNGNLMAVRAKGNAAGHNGNQIRCYNCRGLGHFARDC
nr:ribonuclease H-like domain-containing protein [Tanacetum cinerariifolium]